MTNPMNPLERQIGGAHYQGHKVQPIEIAMGNRLDAATAFALKHMTRPSKGQVRQDIEKTLHYIEFLFVPSWDPVPFSTFVEGLDDEVPAWMRDVARCLLYATVSVARRDHLQEARALLLAQLIVLDEQERTHAVA